MSNMMLVENVKIEKIEVIYEHFFFDEGVIEDYQIDMYTLAVADFARRHDDVRSYIYSQDEPDGKFVILTNKRISLAQVKEIGDMIVHKLTEAAFA